MLLYRADLPQRLPKTWAALAKLEGKIDDAAMRGMNAAAELDGKDFASIASAFIAGAATSSSEAKTSFAADFWRKLSGPDFGPLTLQHVVLVFVSLAASIIIGIPLGILCAKQPASEGVILGTTGIVQTIPADITTSPNAMCQ